ncbi:MAG: hypothetical protein HY925_04540 [Elusimicrobia bacterium]|nr:hypothetical protein [Elusimicrobiota bacterium]
MGLINAIRGRAGSLADLLRGLATRGRWWLIPLLLALIGLGWLLLAAVSQSPVAPFIYTVF